MANTVKVNIQADDSGFKSTLNSAQQTASQFGASLDNAGKKSMTFNGQLRAARKEALELSQAYSQLDDAARSSTFGQELKAQLDTAMQAAGQLTDLKNDVMQEINNLASDTASWDAVSQGMGVLSSGMQGFAGVVGLCGGDVESFTQALTVMNTVQSVTNTIVGIGNALQKQSALMVGLRAAKTALFGATATAAAAAETAETAAISANTTATTANTAATGAATVAQLANNAAVLANPYVACAVAIAALVAGIAIWISSMDEATDSEIANAAAVDAFSEAVDGEMKKVSEQINLYDDLKRQYDECGGKTDEFSRKLINNTDVQKKLGVTVKTVDDVHRLFAAKAGQYSAACMARASAMAAEAAQAALLGQTLSELSHIQAKLMAGEEVNWRDMRKVVEAMGYSSEAADKLMQAAGYVYEGDGMAYGNIKQGTGDLTKLITEINKGGAMKALEDMGKQFRETFTQIDEVDFGGMLTDNLNALDSSTKKAGNSASHAGKKSHGAAKKTNEEVKKVLTSLEGCDAIISDAQKEMKKLDSTSADYADKMQKLKDRILVARIAKLQLIDKSTIKGIGDARKLIQDIIADMPVGTKQYDDWNKKLIELNEKLYEMYQTAAKNGDLNSLGTAKSQIESIIKELPQGSDELIKWARAWRDIDNRITEANRSIDNLKKGIQSGSITWLEQDLKLAQQRLDEWTRNNQAKLLLTVDELEEKTALENAVETAKKNLGNAKVMMEVGVNVQGWKKTDLTFDYKKSPLEKLDRDIDVVREHLDILKDYKLEDVGEDAFNKAQLEIKELEKREKELLGQHTFAELTEDVKQYGEEIRNASIDSFKGLVDGLHNVYDIVTQLPDKLDECENGFEGFFAVMEAGFSLVDSITSFIEGIQKLIDLFNMMAGAKDALSAATAKNTAVTNINTAATQGNAAATQMEAAADTQEAGAAIGKAGANAAEAGSEAGKQMSKMGPFGWIAGIAAALAIAGALFGIISQAKGYAEGGIIQGNHTMGDQLIARVNAGEMILNKRQQSNLFKALDNGINANDVSTVPTSTVRVTGDDLYIALHNRYKRTKKSPFE